MLITDIDTFTRALQQIKSALETCASVPADLMNGIALALEQCFKLLLRVKQRIDAYNSRMTGAVGVGVLRQYWAAVAWEILGGKREVDALRAQLSEQVEVIQTLLAAAHSQNLEEIRRAAAAHNQKLDDVRKDAESTNRNVNEMFASTRELCIRLSATSAAFTFFDASGAQLLPAGVMRFATENATPFGAWTRRNFKRYAPITMTFAKSTCFDHDYVYILDPNPPSKVLGGNPGKHPLDLLMFFYRGDEEGAFVSPVYRTSAKKDPLRKALAPEASAALSEFLRCNSNRRIEVDELAIFIR
ncbi:hypothetical protein EXIGLDRAFT_103629 [Exidia glandulosa HHB12029]|uniref:Uncharacterized protein n=1 Tax=Exidia glandulosa HHB12029 TaxID=1314781 RepID=A0A166AEJ6_EXIGL|nr:hypothetical protein EXIGLDRAFT_103629 [Exidia glandulosa HHB12029]